MMKRQRNFDGSFTTNTMKTKRGEGATTMNMPKKKIKRATDQKLQEEGKSAPMVVENLLGLEELSWLKGAVDEQMSWGSIWLPFWDVEYIGENYSALFSDVLWDDDIWNLKGIKEVPNPSA